ncbi:MAG TPA: nitroreductase family deazaflavin-dependent oxidoreductase [Solirubrobacteraceae bacterium]|jgi:deazaflavin-dependent oxidoreductase (nitroreductase family)|nr:nitroreductase family deazaflavin-dependent oxidoreductase [Solirubrobacteraceae bacterium]
MALRLGRPLARFNRVVTNPIQGQYAWLLPPWVVVCHRGRRTGRLYRTPVNAYRHGSTLAIVVLYGARSDWVRNILAGGGQVVRAGRTYELLDARLVDPRVEPVPRLARPLGRLTHTVLLARLGPAGSGFGRGPAAG